MDRTYNFQVDNGLFVAEYYLDKNYKDITIDDLRDSIELFSERIEVSAKQVKGLSSMTLHNTYYTQKNKKIKDQLQLLLDNIGDKKNCSICGKKQVNFEKVDVLKTNGKTQKEYQAYTTLFHGLPAPNGFMNRSNNMKSIDVCPVCMFLSVLSSVNTQKIGSSALYISDSDEFMRDITADIQYSIDRSEMLEVDSGDIDKKFIETMNELKIDSEIYDDMNYINIVRYNMNPQSPYAEDLSIDRGDLRLINKIKYAGLIHEFYDKGLFRSIANKWNPLKRLVKYGCSIELYNILKEDYMTKKEIELIESITDKLIDIDANGSLRDLKLIRGKNDFKNFLIKYSEVTDLCGNISDYNELIQNFYDYKDYLILNLNLKGDR